MFIRPCYREKDGKRHAYWAVVESYRTAQGPRQRVVSYVGALEDGEVIAPVGRPAPADLFRPPAKPRRIEIDPDRVEVRRCREFGGVWLAWELVRRLGLDAFVARTMPRGREAVPWPLMVWVLVLSRLCDASSELYIAEHLYARSAMPDLLGVPQEKINDDRLYRALDALLPHKAALEVFLKERLGDLFRVEYDLLLYDVTSTYFEGQAEGNRKAKRGYSRDHRPDCKQVCIALVVTRGGVPLGYEVFDGNTQDSRTVRQIVGTMETRYGVADRIWVWDRGMLSQENMAFLREGARRYIVGTPRGQLKAFERELLAQDWHVVREGLEVRLCRSAENADETFILCRSADRRQKERAMHERFEQRIAEGLEQLERTCNRQHLAPVKAAQRLGRLMGANSRAAALFETEVQTAPDGRARLVWSRHASARRWAELSEGCYLLRTNITDWSAEELWTAYTQLTDAETAFRIHKSDLTIRPIWHQKTERVEAHILVCFLAYVLWKTLGLLCKQAGLGDEPRRIFDELGTIRLIDVVMPTTDGRTFTRRCVTRPSDHQRILLQRLGLRLPGQLAAAGL
jgi:transposase